MDANRPSGMAGTVSYDGGEFLERCGQMSVGDNSERKYHEQI